MVQMSQVGIELADDVYKNKQPVIAKEELKIAGTSDLLFDQILFNFAKRGLNSSIIVGEEPSVVSAFTNMLALEMSHEEQLAEYITQILQKKEIINYQAVKRAKSKRLHSFRVNQFFLLGGETRELCHYLMDLVDESVQKDYIWVIDDLSDIFHVKDTRNSELLPAIASQFHYALRSFRLTFITNLSWDDYFYHVENGYMRSLIRYCSFFPLSARPSNLEL